MSEKRSPADTTKREFLKQGSYVVPAILTLAAAPSFASAGSSSSKTYRGGKKPKKEKNKAFIKVKKAWHD